MKALIDPELILERLKLPKHPEAIKTFESVLSSTQTYFEEILQTKLLKMSNVDWFHIDTKLNRHSPDGFFRLRLKNSNIRPSPALTIVGAASYADLMLGRVAFTLDSSKGDFFIDAAKGIVFLNRHIDSHTGFSYDRLNFVGDPVSFFEGSYLKITYDSGFMGSSDVPDWLRESLISYTPWLANQQQVSNKSAEMDAMLSHGKEAALKLLEPYVRDVGLCFKVMRSGA